MTFDSCSIIAVENEEGAKVKMWMEGGLESKNLENFLNDRKY